MRVKALSKIATVIFCSTVFCLGFATGDASAERGHFCEKPDVAIEEEFAAPTYQYNNASFAHDISGADGFYAEIFTPAERVNQEDCMRWRLEEGEYLFEETVPMGYAFWKRFTHESQDSDPGVITEDQPPITRTWRHTIAADPTWRQQYINHVYKGNNRPHAYGYTISSIKAGSEEEPTGTFKLIFHDGDGNSRTVEYPISAISDQSIKMPASDFFENEGKRISLWRDITESTEGDGYQKHDYKPGETINYINTENRREFEFEAVWSEGVYTLTFLAGNYSHIETVNIGESIDICSFELPKSDNNLTLTAWRSKGVLYECGEITPTDDMEFSPGSWNMRYRAYYNDGTEKFDDYFVDYGGSHYSCENFVVPKREGYKFRFWGGSPDADQEFWYCSQNQDNWNQITVYAIWEKLSEESDPETPTDPDDPPTDSDKVKYTFKYGKFGNDLVLWLDKDSISKNENGSVIDKTGNYKCWLVDLASKPDGCGGEIGDIDPYWFNVGAEDMTYYLWEGYQ